MENDPGRLALGALLNIKLWMSVEDLYPPNDAPKLTIKELDKWKVAKALRIINKSLEVFTEQERSEAYKVFLNQNGNSH